MSVARGWRDGLTRAQKARPIPFRGKGATGQTGQVGNSGVLTADVNSYGGCEFAVGGGQANAALRGVNDRDLADFGAWLINMFGNS